MKSASREPPLLNIHKQTIKTMKNIGVSSYSEKKSRCQFNMFSRFPNIIRSFPSRRFSGIGISGSVASLLSRMNLRKEMSNDTESH